MPPADASRIPRVKGRDSPAKDTPEPALKEVL
jgi:hypothetical protein